MKNFLFFFAFIFFCGMNAQVNAQCYLQKFDNAIVQIVSSTPMGASKCEIELNISFDMEYNDGAKYLYITSYLDADYTALGITDPLDFDCGNPATPSKDMPISTRLGTAVDDPGKSFLDIGFDLDPPRPNFGDPPVPVTLITSYVPDPTVVLYHNNISVPAGYTPGLSVTRENIGLDVGHFVITGLKVIINQACNSTIAVRTDLFAANASGATKAQCYDCGSLQLFNDPTMAGAKLCTKPERQYTLNITTVDPVSKDITYKVYLDMNNNGQLDFVVGNPDILAYTSGTIAIDDMNAYSTGGAVSVNMPYSNTQPYSEKAYLVLVEGATLPNNVLKLLSHPSGCLGLPVEFVSFTAVRSNSSVMLKWQTSSESNNDGFAIERYVNGDWHEVGFVPSGALNGNSDVLLSYSYVDNNTSKSITQYRIRQVDLDSKFSYSPIRTVRGIDQSGGILIYPNPAVNGTVNILFEDINSTRDISLIDMNGRIIRQWQSITDHNMTINNLDQGMYTLRIINHESGEHTVEKIIVLKH